jgi:hypothetical protein
MDLQPFPPAQTHAASCSICSVDLKMYTDVGQVLVKFHQSFVQLNAGVPQPAAAIITLPTAAIA